MADSNQDNNDKTAVLTTDPATLRKDLQKARQTEACLIVVRGASQGDRHFITQGELILGRDPTADVSISDPGISRKHAKITKSGSEIVLTDLNSSNGTFINDKKLNPQEPRPLHKEDMIKLGNTIFKFLPAGELETLAWENLHSQAHTDALTKIFNKGYLMEALDSEFKRAKALHTDLSVIFFDLDFFKKINDTYGHEAGDYVLREFSALLRSSHLRPKDVFARYGGEEFVILLANTNAQAALLIAERIRAAVETHAFIYEGKRLAVTSSMGVAELRTDIETAQTLLKAADKALYAAKQGGRNRVVVA